MNDQPPEEMPPLAELLDVDAHTLADAIGDFLPAGTEWDGEVHVYTGRANPRAPERPVVALRVHALDEEVEVGRAVGVPLPDGRMRWTLAAPCTRLPVRDGALLLVDLRDAVLRVLDADMLSGIDW